jgi:hypothetical protein
MGDQENHYRLFEKFRTDAQNDSLFEGTRVEAYFLAAYHLIEACAAKHRVHINKHQKVRSALEDNGFIFNEKTEAVWRAFQTIENQLRPRFSYGFSWTEKDLKEVLANFKTIETICLEVLGK